ncbi:MAG: hypothetical protein H0T42_06960 [Deltaproteobacteria bacterium]|nr:hypothetical protein [Deltaproteobacteria bacterium]
MPTAPGTTNTKVAPQRTTSLKPDITSVMTGASAFVMTSLSRLRTTTASTSRSSIHRASWDRIAASESATAWREITR